MYRYANQPLEATDRITPGELMRIGRAIQSRINHGTPALTACREAAGEFNLTMAAAFTAWITASFTA